MAGRPQLRIGTHGKIKRVYLGVGFGSLDAATETPTESPASSSDSAPLTNTTSTANSQRMH